MRAKINLSDPKTIQSAIKALKDAKKLLVNKVVEEMILECSMAIQTRANEWVAVTDIGDNVKNEIQASWVTTKVPGGYMLSNLAEKAVYVEFGVGIVGESYPHPNANMAGYDYNRESDSKYEDGSWAFFTNEEDLDLPPYAIDSEIRFSKTNNDSRNRLLVFTRGTPATMFLHNAILDFIESGEPQRIWQRLLKKYFG